MNAGFPAMSLFGGAGITWRRQPIEWKLHWILRLGVFMEFVGHGAFGIRTKAGWLPYFHVFAIGDGLAWKLMPVIGAVDISLGIIALLSPRRSFLLWMSVWGLFTALLRPAAGQGWWEFFERAYNFGGPATLLALHGWGSGWKGWWEPLATAPTLNASRAQQLDWSLRGIVALMLIGHGGLGVFTAKQNLLGFYQAAGLGSFGLPLETWRAGIGFFELGLGLAALAARRPSFFVFVGIWKLASELLHPLSGAEGAWWEVIERGSSYAVPAAGACLLLYLLGAKTAPAGRSAPQPGPSPTMA